MTPARVTENFDRTIARLDKPNGDPLTVPNYLLFEEASSEVAMMLNGEGGDPCFGGPKNLPMLLSELFGNGEMFETMNDSREASYLCAHQECYDDSPRMLSDEMLHLNPAAALESELTSWLTDIRYPSFINRLMAVNVIFKGATASYRGLMHYRLHMVYSRAPLFDRSVVSQHSRSRRRLNCMGRSKIPAQTSHFRRTTSERYRPTKKRDAGAGGALVSRTAPLNG